MKHNACGMMPNAVASILQWMLMEAKLVCSLNLLFLVVLQISVAHLNFFIIKLLVKALRNVCKYNDNLWRESEKGLTLFSRN